MPHCPVTVVQRYRDEVCNLLFHLFFIICHPYIPLHLEEIIFYTLRLSSSGIDGGREGPIGSSGFSESGTGRCVAFGFATCGYDRVGDYTQEKALLSLVVFG